MSWDENGKIWMDGKIIDWNDAKIHVLSHVVHYGSSVFEGIRCYSNNKGSAIFRLEEHIQRLFDSAKIYRMEIDFTHEQLCDACKEIIVVNNLESCYIRPVAYRGYKSLGVNPVDNPTNTTIAVWEWGAYLGDDALENGVDVGVSSWRRMAPNTLPSMAKAGANYMNSQLAIFEYLENGYDEAIMLDTDGFVGEGTGENIFVINNGEIYTPSLDSGVLAGITRDSVMKIANDLGYKVKERKISRESLYLADEIFFTGTAAEVTPVRSVDGIVIGEGKRGLITGEIQSQFFNIIGGKVKDKYGWLTYLD
ncbi:MAG: branched-chain-amino-acid transaminase [Methanobacteriaceae archaeon]